MGGNGKFLDLDQDNDCTHPQSWLMAPVPHQSIRGPPPPPTRRTLSALNFSHHTPGVASAWSCWPRLVRKLDWKEKKKDFSPQIQNHPSLFYRWKIISTTSSRKLQREVIIQKWGGDERPREAQMQCAGRLGAGAGFPGSFNQSPIFKVSFSTIICWP